jgi:TolB-like protein/tetratricopeptide (TPR) repeat protein
MAFIDELKQRKVVRVGLAYLVAAWLGIQVASIALPAFGAPGWVLRVLILVLALGFPLALVLAWAIDLTPEGPRFVPGGTGWKRLLAFSAALGLLAVGWYVLGQPAWRAGDLAGEGAAPAAATPAPARSIAVLPFVNMSGDPANEYFSDGLAETTLDMLAQVHDLKVIARTSSFAFKGKAIDVREIGRKLDAAHLLEGSVQQSGKTVRITAQLVRTSDGAHVWSQRYDRQLTDVFAIQDEIATEVVRALQLALPAAEAARVTGKRTGDVGAYQEYLRGVALMPGRRVPDMRRALAYFQHAIALDPKYAKAYAAASMTLMLLDNYAGKLTPAEQALQTSYTETALKLAPGLGEAYAARGAVRENHGDFSGAVEDYKRAIELSPSFATAWQWYGELAATELGDPVLSRRLLARAVELDPLSPVVRGEFAISLAEGGDTDRALAELDRVLQEHPETAVTHLTRARIFEARGDLVAALREYRSFEAADPDARSRRGERCETLLRFGALPEAEACVERARGPHGEDLAEGARVRLKADSGEYAEALALNAKRRRPDRWLQAQLLLTLGRAPEALALLQKLEPGMFMQPAPQLTSGYAGDAINGGMALIDSGAQAQGRDLLQRALKANADKPITVMNFGRGWSDVYIWALLGDNARACAAAREAVAAGLYTDMNQFRVHPRLAELRKQPCFEAAIAPARAKAAAQIAAARAAGLL